MPIFSRSDGTLIKNESRVRRIMPYLMRGRNESAVYHEQTCDLTVARRLLRDYNRAHDQAATLFHVFLFAFGRLLHERPGLNRFVSGGRLYQRKKVELSFAAKKRMAEDAPLVTVKLEALAGEAFPAFVDRVVAAIRDGRSDEEKAVDVELKLALALPGPLLRMVMALLRGLDRMNLLPSFMTANDPMYASCFVANLGSIGLDRTFHHLYEYGTVSLFAAIGQPKKTLLVGRDGKPEVKDAIEARFTLDERINDGFYCAESLARLKRMIERPEALLGVAGALPPRSAEA